MTSLAVKPQSMNRCGRISRRRALQAVFALACQCGSEAAVALVGQIIRLSVSMQNVDALRVAELICDHTTDKSQGVLAAPVRSFSTEEGYESLRRLEAEFLLSRSDWSHWTWRGHKRLDTLGYSDLRVVANIYQEVLHLIVPRESSVKTLKQLSSVRVAVAKAQSKFGADWELFFRHMVPARRFLPVPLDFADCLEALRQQHVQAALVFAPIEHPGVTELLKSGDFVLRSISPERDDSLLLRYRFLFFLTVQPHHYPHIESPITTLGLNLQLLTDRKRPEDEVSAVLEGYIEALEHQSDRAYPILLKQQALVQHMSLPLHPGAESVYQKLGWLR